jgi:dinuclear metal center YbgI/SA1388 family protein
MPSAYDWDKQIGLQLGSRKQEINKVLLSLDVTSQEIDLAIKNKCDLIIAHHALFFNPIQKINLNNPLGKSLEKLIKNNIGVYIIHTNMDAAPELGLGVLYAGKLGLAPTKCEIIETTYTETFYKLAVFVPEKNAEEVFNATAQAGAGHIGNYSHCSFQIPGTGTFIPGENTKPHIGKKGKLEKVSEIKIETLVSESNKNEVIKAMLKAHPYEEVAYDLYPLSHPSKKYGVGLVGTLDKPKTINGKKIKRIGLVTGSGGSFVEKAYRMGAEAFYTGEAKYHDQILAKELGVELVCEGHRETEEIFIEPLKKKLNQQFSNLKILV